MLDSKKPRYARILLKLSGEALAGNKDMGIDAQVLDQMSLAIAHLVGLGVQVGIVVGGGNLYRGSQLQKDGLVGRVTGDQMGMLATVMNGLAMRDALVRRNIKTRLMSALPIGTVVESYSSRDAIRHLTQGEVCVFVAGTGNPFFTTDTAACLRGIEIEANLILIIRFHQLPEFDLEKRSCRRRLAGHNERRRKPQPASLSVLSSRYGRITPSLYG